MITIRCGQPKDLEHIVMFQLRMALETEGLTLDLDTVTQGVRAVFEDPSKGEYWVAEKDGQIVGGLLTIPEWSDWRNGTVLWIHSVYVVPKFRQQGVFKRLYMTLKEHVEASSDLCGLRLYVDKRNRQAQKVYEAMGMDGSHYRLYEWLK